MNEQNVMNQADSRMATNRWTTLSLYDANTQQTRI